MKKILVVLVLASLLLTACQPVDGTVTGTRARTVMRVSWANGYAEDVSHTLYYIQLDDEREIEVTFRVYSMVGMGDECSFTKREPYDSVSCVAPTSKAGGE